MAILYASAVERVDSVYFIATIERHTLGLKRPGKSRHLAHKNATQLVGQQSCAAKEETAKKRAATFLK